MKTIKKYINLFNFLFRFCLLLFLLCCENKPKTSGIDKQVNPKKVVISLYGVPACGKLSLATKLATKYNLHLVDNHFFNNIIFQFIELNTSNIVKVYSDIIKIKKLWFDNVAKYKKDNNGFVFTNVFLDTKDNINDVSNLKTFAKQLGYKWLPIKIICSEKDIKKRINTEQRKKKFKLVDFDKWKQYVDNAKFLDIENSLIIENKNIEKTMEIISKEIDKIND